MAAYGCSHYVLLAHKIPSILHRSFRILHIHTHFIRILLRIKRWRLTAGQNSYDEHAFDRGFYIGINGILHSHNAVFTHYLRSFYAFFTQLHFKRTFALSGRCKERYPSSEGERTRRNSKKPKGRTSAIIFNCNPTLSGAPQNDTLKVKLRKKCVKTT